MRSARSRISHEGPVPHPALWPVLGFIALYGAFYVQFAAQLIAFPFGVDQGEGYDAWGAWLIHLGQLPYTTNDTFPYFSSNYPPLWSALVSLPMGWTGPTLASGRAVSTLAALLAGLLVALAAFRHTRRDGAHDSPLVAAPPVADRTALLAAILAAGFFFASPYVFHTTPLARVNSVSLGCAVLAVSLFEVPVRWRLGLGTLALLVAMFTKPTAADAVAACLVCVFFTSRRDALLAAALLAVVGLIAVIGLNAVTAGAFWTNVAVANANPFDGEQLAKYLLNFGALHAAAVGLAGLETARALRRRVYSPWVGYFIAAGALSLSVGKWGAGESYFLGTIAAACVLSGSCTARLLHQATGNRQQAIATSAQRAAVTDDSRRTTPDWLRWVLGGALLLQMLVMAHGPLSRTLSWLPDRGMQAEFLGRAPSLEDRDAGDAIAALVRNTDGPVLSEEPSFAIMAGKPVVGNATQLRNLYQVGRWNPESLMRDVTSRQYGLVILNAELYPAPVLAAIGRSYYLERTVQMGAASYKLFLPGGEGGEGNSQ